MTRRIVKEAWQQNAVVLGYDIHGQPWYWPDRVRVMQGIVLGMTGTGKTTLLRNIISQDLARSSVLPISRIGMPMVIFDGKGDLEFFQDLLPHVHRAGRLHQLRLLNPARPDLSVRYNPFQCADDEYMPVVSMIFGSFNLRKEFFAKHQLNYLADIVRVLFYTGLKFNFYDVLVMAMDERVMKEQVEKARKRIALGLVASHAAPPEFRDVGQEPLHVARRSGAGAEDPGIAQRMHDLSRRPAQCSDRTL